MIRFTGKATFNNLQKYASENDCVLNIERGSIKYNVYDKVEDKAIGFHNLKEVKKGLELIAKSRYTESKLTEVIECKDIVDALKAVKANLSFNAAYKDTHKLYLAVHNSKLLAITDNGSKYAIATAPYINTNDEFYLVLPIEREIGFCRFLEVIRKQKKLHDFSYQLTDERLIAKYDGSKFEFNILPTDVFKISTDLRVIIDEFMGYADGYKVVDTYGIDAKPLAEYPDTRVKYSYSEQNKEKSHNHICFDGLFEYFFIENKVYKVCVFNLIASDTKYRFASDLIGTFINVLDFHHSYNKQSKQSPYPKTLIDYLYQRLYTGQSCELPVLEVENKPDRTNETTDKSASDKEVLPASIIPATQPTIEDKQQESKEVNQHNNKEIIETTMNNTTTQLVPGIGNVELLPVDKLQRGMYLYFDNLLYTVSNIEQVDFINSDSSYIVTVNTLLDATKSQKILLSGNEQLAAWAVNFEPVVTKVESKPATEDSIKEVQRESADRRLDDDWQIEDLREVKRDKTEECKVAKRNIKPAIDIDDLPKQVRPATGNYGIKGKGRQMFLKMLSEGATIQQVMSSFNWSKKTATNQINYVKSWGYNLERISISGSKDKLYKVV